MGRAAFAVAVLLHLACGAPKPAAQPAAEPSTPSAARPAAEITPDAGLPADVRAHYEAAKPAVEQGDWATAERSFRAAVEARPDFTEAWYNLGSTLAREALDAAAVGRDADALAYFRASVDAKRRAQALANSGTWYVYRPGQEQDIMLSDLREALRDADAVLADEASLLAALRLMAGQRR
jgi:hypothetical protein